MKTKLLAMMLLAGGSMFAQTRFSIGIGLGGSSAGFNQVPSSYESAIPPCPGPDYTWVDGYWSENYGRNTWVPGYWNRRPFIGGYVAAPRLNTRLNDRDERQGFSRGFQQDRNRGLNQDRNSSVENRNQTRGVSPSQPRDFGQNQRQNQNTGNRNGNSQGTRQGSVYANGFKAR